MKATTFVLFMSFYDFGEQARVNILVAVHSQYTFVRDFIKLTTTRWQHYIFFIGSQTCEDAESKMPSGSAEQ